MSLKDLDLKSYGHFEDGASFSMDSCNLPGRWEYFYQNRDLLLKMDQFGPAHAQERPPAGDMLFKRDQFEKCSSWLVWLLEEGEGNVPFSNFFNPNGFGDPRKEPDSFNAVFSPIKATYTLEMNGLRCVTEFMLPTSGVTVMMRLEVTNLSEKSRTVKLIPALRTYFNPARLAPWDQPEWYLKSGATTTDGIGFWSQLMNMDSRPEKRKTWGFWTSETAATGLEISYDKFVGAGDWRMPENAYSGTSRMGLNDGGDWGEYNETNTIYGYPPVFATFYEVVLTPGETAEIHQAVTLLPQGENFTITNKEDALKAKVFITKEKWQEVERENQERWDTMRNVRSVKTPDGSFNEYVNDWLALQLDWVCSLDRGWPSGMRGSRDSANDFTGLVAVDPKRSADILTTLMSCQQKNGWFPRQYSADGRLGTHDMRGHVDAGVWVVELLYEYLCHTKDFDILNVKTQWLDDETDSTVFDHTLRIFDYYLNAENIGEHGICKIREGDWLDSVNRAGLEGRGESVMVTCQLVIALTQMCAILERTRPEEAKLIQRYEKAKAEFTANLREHAFNPSGYYNSVFTDNGEWIFSNRDPDGERRFYGPANWYAICSGVAEKDQYASIFENLNTLKCEMGYRLYWPPMGNKPITSVGRGGTGDQPAGLWENGNVYNQGSQGFLARALAVAGDGDHLIDVLRHMLPYEQSIHPIEKTKTPPYAVVNCWQQIPGFTHRGGLQCLTGSIAAATRAVYEGMIGFKPTLDGVMFDPCLPKAFDHCEATVSYRGKKINIEIDHSNDEATSMIVNGKNVKKRQIEQFSGRCVPVIDDTLLNLDINHVHIRLCQA